MGTNAAWADRLAGMREERRERLEVELPRLVEGLARLGAGKVILFGSMAGGRVGLTSDIDLIAVIETRRPFVERLEWVWRELNPTCADILVYTPEEFQTMREISPFVRHALATGKVMHEAFAA